MDTARAIVDALPKLATVDDRVHSVLVTAPHGCSERPPLDDPCSAELARSLCKHLKRVLPPTIAVVCVVATKSRAQHDQNRLAGMFAADDMIHKLRGIREQNGGTFRGFAHVDVHTFTCNARRLPDGWGRSFNLIHLHGYPRQAVLANKVRDALKKTSRVIPMDRLPTSPTDDDSNAMIEYTTANRAAVAFLVELPTKMIRTHTPNSRMWIARPPGDRIFEGKTVRLEIPELKHRTTFAHSPRSLRKHVHGRGGKTGIALSRAHYASDGKNVYVPAGGDTAPVFVPQGGEKALASQLGDAFASALADIDYEPSNLCGPSAPRAPVGTRAYRGRPARRPSAKSARGRRSCRRE